MSDQLDERIENLLNELENVVESLPPPAKIDEEQLVSENGEVCEINAIDGDLLQLADEANELIETESPDALIDAVGLSGGDTGYDSIPEAITQGEPEAVADLRVLVKLAKLAGQSEPESVVQQLEILRESVADRPDSADQPDSADETGADHDDGDDESSTSGSIGKSVIEAASAGFQSAVEDVTETDESENGVTEDETNADSDQDADVEAAESDEDDEQGDETDTDGTAEEDSDEIVDVGEELRAATSSALEEFGEEVDGLRSQFETLRTDTSEDDQSDTDTTDEQAEGPGGRPGTGSTRNPTTFSTMAPRPSNRPDVGRTSRFSTMPDRDG